MSRALREADQEDQGIRRRLAPYYDFANGVSAGGFGQSEGSAAATAIGKALPQTRPIGH